MAWKKENANISFLNSAGLLQSVSILLFKLAYVLNKLDLRPVGGSSVILTDVWSTDTGNFSEGIDVSQILNSGLIYSESYSTIASSLGIQEVDK